MGVKNIDADNEFVELSEALAVKTCIEIDGERVKLDEGVVEQESEVETVCE